MDVEWNGVGENGFASPVHNLRKTSPQCSKLALGSEEELVQCFNIQKWKLDVRNNSFNVRKQPTFKASRVVTRNFANLGANGWLGFEISFSFAILCFYNRTLPTHPCDSYPNSFKLSCITSIVKNLTIHPASPPAMPRLYLSECRHVHAFGLIAILRWPSSPVVPRHHCKWRNNSPRRAENHVAPSSSPVNIACSRDTVPYRCHPCRNQSLDGDDEQKRFYNLKKKTEESPP